MLGWRTEINIKQYLDRDKEPLDIGRAIAKELEAARPEVERVVPKDEREFCLEQLDEIISLIEDDEDVEDLDGRLEELYNWGDEYRVLLYGEEPDSYWRE